MGPCLRCSSDWGETSPTQYKHLQDFIVAGGRDGDGLNNRLSSVLTLVPGATAWIQLASLPRPLIGARASVVGGRLRVNGGRDNGAFLGISEVMIDK